MESTSGSKGNHEYNHTPRFPNISFIQISEGAQPYLIVKIMSASWEKISVYFELTVGLGSLQKNVQTDPKEGRLDR